MIFVTVGSLFPFDRLIQAIDLIAPSFPDERFVAQIGKGKYEPQNMKFARILDATSYMRSLKESRVMVAHAGMGSVIAAMENHLPIVLFPRRQALGEVTTDHQLATAKWLSGRGGVHIALDQDALAPAIRAALTEGVRAGSMGSEAPEPFLRKLRDFIGDPACC